MTSIVQTLEHIGDEAKPNAGEAKQSLQHSLQFYSIYAETGDSRYLNMCDDFLRQSIELGK